MDEGSVEVASAREDSLLRPELRSSFILVLKGGFANHCCTSW